jgi:hypothetical protein
MKLRVVLLVALAGSAAACHRNADSPAPVPAKPKAGIPKAAPAPQGPNPQQLTAGMVEAVAQGKSQGSFDLKFDLLERPVPGKPLEIALALLPQTAAGSATVAVTGAEGLDLQPGDERFEFPAVEAARVYRHSVKVTPASEGLYVLTLSVSLQHEQTSDSRVFSVPILVDGAGGSPAHGGPAANAAPPAEAAKRGS